MSGYSKMRVGTDSTANKSRSMDLSDPSFSSPQPKQAQELASPGLKMAQQREADMKPHDLFSWPEGGAGGQAYGVRLSRTCSSASQRFRASERASGSGNGLQGVVRRAFSMRKGSTVAEGYWRIHDTADEDGEESREEHPQQMRPSSRKKKGRIVRACKRLFGF